MIIKGKCAPTIKTVGAVGDIYVDEKNGNRYRCIYSCIIGGEVDCEWEPDKIEYGVKLVLPEKVVAKFDKELVEVGPDIDENSKPDESKIAELVKTIDKPTPKPHYNNQPQQKRKYTNYRKENYNGKN